MHTDAHVRALRRLSAWQTAQEFELGIQERFAAPFNGGLVSFYIDASDFAPSIRPAVRWGVAPLPAWRLAIGSILVCFGLALVAFSGISGDGPLGLRTLALLPPFLGAALTRRWGTERAPA